MLRQYQTSFGCYQIRPEKIDKNNIEFLSGPWRVFLDQLQNEIKGNQSKFGLPRHSTWDCSKLQKEELQLNVHTDMILCPRCSIFMAISDDAGNYSKLEVEALWNRKLMLIYLYVDHDKFWVQVFYLLGCSKFWFKSWKTIDMRIQRVSKIQPVLAFNKRWIYASNRILMWGSCIKYVCLIGKYKFLLFNGHNVVTNLKHGQDWQTEWVDFF